MKIEEVNNNKNKNFSEFIKEFSGKINRRLILEELGGNKNGS